MKYLKLLLTAVIAVALSGCVRTRLVFDVKKDGSYSQHIELLLKEDVIREENDDVGAYLEELAQNIHDEYPETEITEIKEGKKENAYAGLRIRGLSNAQTMITISRQGRLITVAYPLREAQDAFLAEIIPEGYTAEQLGQEGVEATVNIRMPGKPETNIGTVEGKTVIIDLADLGNDAETATVTCMIPDYRIPIAACIAVFLIIAMLIVLLLKRQRA